MTVFDPAARALATSLNDSIWETSLEDIMHDREAENDIPLVLSVTLLPHYCPVNAKGAHKMPLAVSFSDPSPSEPWVCTVLEYYQVTREVHRYRLLQVEVCYPSFEIHGGVSGLLTHL